MADIIRILPNHIANQIAAGEVVQRPASVIKELLENSIDSKAKKIQIFLKNGGKSLIHIIDDGNGMSWGDAKLCFLRHSTSKISSCDDLFKINTKGFRGEALASIASVSQMQIKTSENKERLGIELYIEEGKLKSEAFLKMPKGTQVVVRNLFYNIPVRRNFLKNTQIEFRAILDEFHKISLAHPEIEFEIYHNNELISALKNKSLRHRIVGIFGNKIDEQLIPLDEKTQWCQIRGFVARPTHSKKYRKEQFFFVNHRYIRSSYLYKGILDAFEGLLRPLYHPSFFIFIDIDPKHIDINIHPSKTEIKFEDEASLFTFVKASVKHALGQYQVMPVLDFENKLNWEIPADMKRKNFISAAPKIKVDPTYNPFLKDFQDKNQELFKNTKELYKGLKKDDSLLIVEKNVEEEKSLFLFENENKSEENYFQLYQSYILTQKGTEFILINQHRAHLKILYERFLNLKHTNKQDSQTLLFPITIELNPTELMWIKDLLKDLKNQGFELDFDKNILICKSKPPFIETQKIKEFIENLLSNPNLLQEKGLSEKKIAYSMAKASALKAQIKLGFSQMKQITKLLFSLSEPNYTPKGNLIFVKLGKDFIEKQFYK